MKNVYMHLHDVQSELYIMEIATRSIKIIMKKKSYLGCLIAVKSDVILLNNCQPAINLSSSKTAVGQSMGTWCPAQVWHVLKTAQIFNMSKDLLVNICYGLLCNC